MLVLKVLLCIILLITIGITMLLKPNLFWRINHYFTTDGGAPTEAYRGFVRAAGVVLLVLALVIVGVWLYYGS